jgi:hypothetical protein
MNGSEMFGDEDDDLLLEDDLLPSVADLEAIASENIALDTQKTSADAKSLMNAKLVQVPLTNGGTGWKGEELSFLRDLFKKPDFKLASSVLIDLSNLVYLESGTFGFFYDLLMQGRTVYVLGPIQKVRNMRWFKEFAVPVEGQEEVFQLKMAGNNTVPLPPPPPGKRERKPGKVAVPLPVSHPDIVSQ